MKKRNPNFIINKEDIKGTFVLRRFLLTVIGNIIIGFSIFGFIVNIHGQGFIRSLYADTLGILLFFAAIGFVFRRTSKQGVRKIEVNDNGDIRIKNNGREELLKPEDYQYVRFIQNSGKYKNLFMVKIIFSKVKITYPKRILMEFFAQNIRDGLVFYTVYWHREKNYDDIIAPDAIAELFYEKCLKAGFVFKYKSGSVPITGMKENIK